MTVSELITAVASMVNSVDLFLTSVIAPNFYNSEVEFKGFVFNLNSAMLYLHVERPDDDTDVWVDDLVPVYGDYGDVKILWENAVDFETVGGCHVYFSEFQVADLANRRILVEFLNSNPELDNEIFYTVDGKEVRKTNLR